MPRRPGKLSPEEKALAAEISREHKKDLAAARIAKRGAAIKLVGKNLTPKGPGVKLLKSVIGGRLYDTALDRFGGAIVARAAAAMNAARKDTEKRRVARTEKARAALKERGLTNAEIARHRARALPRVRVPEVRFVPVKGRAYKYARETRKGNRYVRDGKTFKTLRGANSAKLAHKKLEARAKIAEALGVSLSKALQIERVILRQARLDLAKFKKTDAYKKRGKRWKQGLTERRWKAASIMALYELLDIVFES